MSNEDRVAELSKRVNVTLSYSETLKHKKSTKPDAAKLKKLAREIRKNLKDFSSEATVQPQSSGRFK